MRKITNYVVPVLLILVGTSCEKKAVFEHEVIELNGISNAKIAYAENGAPVKVMDLELTKFQVNRVNDTTQIAIQSPEGTTFFDNIPPKYINMDAKIEVSRNEFKEYFPEEWVQMKGAKYTSLRLMDRNDKQIFMTIVVYSHTGNEIARHSEDY